MSLPVLLGLGQLVAGAFAVTLHSGSVDHDVYQSSIPLTVQNVGRQQNRPGLNLYGARKIMDMSMKYSSVYSYGDEVYVIPWNAEEFLVIDATTGEKIAELPTSGLGGTPNNKFCGAIYHDGKVYAAPFDRDHILVYDVQESALSGIPIAHVQTGGAKNEGIAVHGSSLYTAPMDAENMLIHDTVTGETRGVSTAEIATGSEKWSGAIAHGNRIYCTPNNADAILVYDATTGKISGVPTTSLATGRQKWQGFVAHDEKLYAAPYNAEHLLVYDTELGTVSGVSTASVLGGPAKWWGITQVGRKLYAGPASGSKLLSYDVDTFEVSGLKMHMPIHDSSRRKYGWLGSANGTLYLPPLDLSAIQLVHVL